MAEEQAAIAMKQRELAEKARASAEEQRELAEKSRVSGEEQKSIAQKEGGDLKAALPELRAALETARSRLEKLNKQQSLVDASLNVIAGLVKKVTVSRDDLSPGLLRLSTK
jgi:predicted nuclease with TOPRIM domain